MPPFGFGPGLITSADLTALLSEAPQPKLVETYRSGVLNLAAVNLGIVLVPALPGFFPVMISRNWVIRTSSMNQITPATVRAGSDAGHVNFCASSAQPATATVNAAALLPSLDAGPGFPAVGLQRFTGTPIICDIPVAATGGVGFALTAELIVHVGWYAG